MNGFGSYSGQDIDFSFLQACEGVCRDEFVPDVSYLTCEEYKKAVGDKPMTEDIAKAVFDKCFKRSYNVQFLFNTDMKEFK